MIFCDHEKCHPNKYIFSNLIFERWVINCETFYEHPLITVYLVKHSTNTKHTIVKTDKSSNCMIFCDHEKCHPTPRNTFLVFSQITPKTTPQMNSISQLFTNTKHPNSNEQYVKYSPHQNHATIYIICIIVIPIQRIHVIKYTEPTRPIPCILTPHVPYRVC